MRWGVSRNCCLRMDPWAILRREERIWNIGGLITWAVLGNNPDCRGKKSVYNRALRHCPILGKVSWSYQPNKPRLPRKYNNTFPGPDWLIKDTNSIHHLPLQVYKHMCQKCADYKYCILKNICSFRPATSPFQPVRSRYTSGRRTWSLVNFHNYSRWKMSPRL
jgi:hypothetical protein